MDVLASALRELRGKGVQDIAAVLATRASNLAPIVEHMATSLDEDLPPEHRAQIDELALSIQRTEVFRVATALLPEARAFTAEVVSVLAWALSSDSCTALDAAFAQEVMSLREQIDALCSGGRA